MSFKLQIVQEIEQGQLGTESQRLMALNRSTVVKWLRKFGSFDWENQTPLYYVKVIEQDEDLETKVKLLENRSLLERQAFVADKKKQSF
jgi:hypothetical protein